ncbi:MAG TPA: hypothetical protein VGB85_04440 [Nannocystis sp.]|jgi:hypothetical protein
MRDTKLIHVFGFFAAVLCASVPGCGDDNDDGGSTNASVTAGDGNAAEIQSTCDTYCNKSQTCDDGETLEQCVADCKAQLGDCMADEQDQVMQELRDCAQESCDDFGSCTFGTGLQCTFGI